MRTVTLVSLGLGGAGVATGAGFAINNYINKENIKSDETITQSIKERIEQSKKSKNKVFITSSGLDLNDIKNKYEQSSDDSKRPKPKNTDGTKVDKEKLVEWCTNNSNNKFGIEDSTYKLILSWCFLNPKTIAEEMASDKREIYSEEGETGEKWKEAWRNYSKDKTKTRLSDVDDGLAGLNGDQDVAGGKALHKWCDTKNKVQKKLYEDGMEEAYELFNLWCTKPK